VVNVDELLVLVKTGEDVYDEPEVDCLSHALQCGAILRAERPDDDGLAIAGLLHDIADIAEPRNHENHETRGARLLAPMFGTRVAKLVAAHVIAKRYLVATEPGYRAVLSPRSVDTLLEQGDALGDLAIRRLAEDPDLDDILRLRRADDRAKDPDGRPPGLDSWRSLLEANMLQ
jgi:predicted HD phosphohydrolase